MVLQRIPCAAPLTSSGTAQACLDQSGPSEHNRLRPHTASGQISQSGRSGTLLQECQRSKRPCRTLKYRIPGVRLHHSAEILASTSCTGDLTSPLTSPSRPSNTTAETRFSLVALHAGLSSSHRLRPHAPTRTPPAQPGSVHPTRRTGGGGGMLRHAGYPTALRWGYYGVRLPLGKRADKSVWCVGLGANLRVVVKQRQGPAFFNLSRCHRKACLYCISRFRL